MANDELPPGWVMTAAGPVREEQQAIREQLGTAELRLTEEEIAASGARRAESEVFEDPLATFAERALGAATFGLTDVLAGTESRYERGRRVEFNPLAATAGTLAGAVVPGLLSGGSGAAGSLARLTPAGRVAAVANRMATNGGVLRAVAGGALEGVAGGVGDYIARVALDDDAEFSADGLLGSAITGGALGGVLGGVGVLGARGAKKAETSLEAALQRRAEAAAQAAAAPARKGSRQIIKTSTLMRRAQVSRSADDLRAVASRIDDMAARNLAKEADDLEAIIRRAPMTESENAALAKLRELDVARTEAVRGTRSAFDKYAAESGLAALAADATEDAARRTLREASAETLDEVASEIARIDRVERDVSQAVGDLRARAEAVEPGSTASIGVRAPEVDTHSGPLSSALDAVKSSAQGARRALDAGATAAGALEIAGSAGIDLPRPSDIVDIGPIGALWLKGKAGLAVLRKTSAGFPASKATAAAQRVRQVEDGLRESVMRAARGVARAAQRPAAVLTPARAAAAVADLAHVDNRAEAEAAAASVDGTTTAVQAAVARSADRAAAYLRSVAPKDPNPNRPPTAPTWAPSQAQAMEFQRRARVVADPDWGIDQVLTNPLAVWEADALRAVYPSVYAMVGQAVLDNLEEFRRTHTLAQLSGLGRRLGIPLTIDTTPSYVPAYRVQASRATAPSPTFTRPSTPGASPTVRDERVE